jgi:AcrR family transcriptional regulator
MARTLSAIAHTKVLAATAELVAERGIDPTSMDSIAQRSGVSKATIYKHWVDKDALLVEMLMYLHGTHVRPKFDTGNTRADIQAVLSYHPQSNVVLRQRIMPHLAAYSSTRKEFGQVWKKAVMDPPRRELLHLLQLGMQRGELQQGLDLEFCLTLLLGPLMYWVVFLRQDAEHHPPEELPAKVVEVFWRAFGVKEATKKTRRAS